MFQIHEIINELFADYKETVIELLQRVCTLSMETMRIIGEMPFRHLIDSVLEAIPLKDPSALILNFLNF